ncbi:hypothetical protein THOM_2425 [Trachipleistophora hominis]|uniref:Uncharacterized protein n=1 Tax=Trachipleistophora hominis TaxID=72359 RepID=L7JUC6_TRAHO|nr:hypothetical protein THOM_2425 [Trachipleistophora hominis]
MNDFAMEGQKFSCFEGNFDFLLKDRCGFMRKRV